MRARQGNKRPTKKGRAARAVTRVAEPDVSEQQDELLMNEEAAFQAEQVKLDDKELDMDHSRALNATNPQAAQNHTTFSYKERLYKKDELIDQMVVHFSIDGDLIQADSEEAQEQEEFLDSKRQEAAAAIKASQVEEGMPSEMTHETLLRSLRNQFNFAERTAQTFSNIVKKRGISTEPPPQMELNATVT